MRNRIIDSRQIAAFSALVRHRSFTRAAEDLFLTQSAVSHAIKSLEEEIGCRLFERSGRSVSLTRAGEQFHQRTERILSEMRAARVEIENLSSEVHGQLSVGAGTLACQYLMPLVLKEFKERHPQCTVLLEPGHRDDLLTLLRTHKIDVALTIEGPRSPDLVFEPLFTDELLFFVSAQHAWSRLGRVPRPVVAKETAIVPDRSTQTFKLVEDHFRTEKLVFRNVVAPGSIDAAKQLVKTGFGVGVFAPWQVAAETAAGEMVPAALPARRLSRQWLVARLKGSQSLPLEQEFVKRCQAALEKLGTVVSLLISGPSLVSAACALLDQLGGAESLTSCF